MFGLGRKGPRSIDERRVGVDSSTSNEGFKSHLMGLRIHGIKPSSTESKRIEVLLKGWLIIEQ